MEQRVDVLMIEDDPDSALLMSLHLSEACGGDLRFSLETAQTLAEGLEMLGRREYSVVLLDLSLPDSRGLETVRRLRASAKDVPVVVLTNLSDEKVAFEAVAEGAQDFLTKERFEPHQLRRALGYAIERSRHVSELRRLEKLRNDAAERQRVEKFKDQVLSTVSHELRSPMTIAKAAICNLIDGLAGPLVDDQKQLLTIAERNLERLARLINNFLDLERLESGRAKVQPRAVELGLLARQLAEERALAHATLRFEAPRGQLTPAWVDPDMVAQLMTNLLDNACRHAKAAVSIQAAETEGEVVVRIVDDGPGIPAEKATNLFQRFVQLDRPTAGAGYKGTGLGLAICQEITRVNGGRIWLEPPDGRGAVFGFALPIARAQEAAAHEQAPAEGSHR